MWLLDPVRCSPVARDCRVGRVEVDSGTGGRLVASIVDPPPNESRPACYGLTRWAGRIITGHNPDIRAVPPVWVTITDLKNH